MTDPTPTPLGQAEADDLGRELTSLLVVEAATKKRIDEIKARFRDGFEYGPHLAANLKVSIEHNVTRDNAAFAEAYPFEAYPEFYKPAPDAKAINDALPPSVLRTFQVEGAPKVIVKALDA